MKPISSLKPISSMKPISSHLVIRHLSSSPSPPHNPTSPLPTPQQTKHGISPLATSLAAKRNENQSQLKRMNEQNKKGP